MNRPASFAGMEGFAAARRCFVELADARILEIAGYQESREAGLSAAEAMRGIAGVAHRIHGVAATLGYAGLGEAAARLELWLQEAAQGPDPERGWAEAQGRTEAFLDLLETVLDD